MGFRGAPGGSYCPTSMIRAIHVVSLFVVLLAGAVAGSAVLGGCQARPGEASGETAGEAAGADSPSARRADPAATASARPVVTMPPVDVQAVPGEDVAYRLRFPAPQTHYVEVEAVLPVVRKGAGNGGAGGEAAGNDHAAAASAGTIEVFMPVWTPGSYMVREYSRHLENVSAATVTGTPLAIEKISKNRWRVHAGSEARVVVRYRVYAREMSVRTNFVDADLAVLNGAATFLTVDGAMSRAHEVAVELPAQWAHSVTGMPPHPDGAPHHYLVPDYDTLVDSPLVLGNPTMHRFEVEGVPHRIATFGGGELWDGDRVARDTEAVVRAQVRLWGAIPYRDYVFLSVLEGGGGLEHRNSTLMMGNPWMTRTRKDYLRWLGLTSHEFFHTWNIKRLRPASLGPFDYEREVYTRSLWVVEGITSYYDDLMLRRAGLMDDKEYLEALSRQIEDVETEPGRKVQSLAMSSYDAWIKFYRPDENSANSDVSYYRKGAVVGFLLDMEIRQRSNGRRSLDDVMRLAYERYGGERGYTAAEFRALVGEVAGEPLDDFFARAVDATEDLDYEPALRYLGLRFAAKKGSGNGDGQAGGEDGAGKETPGWLGVRAGNREGRLVVTGVRRETPAYEAGLNVDDELLAMDGHRLPADGLDDRLRYYRPGDRAELLVARRGRLRTLEVTLGRKPEPSFTLEPAPGPGAQQAARRKAWLGGIGP